MSTGAAAADPLGGEDDVDRSPVANADVCVIGAGPAGALVADRLAADHNVVVLDAGPRFDPADRLARQERAIRPAYDRPDVWDVGGERDAHTTAGERSYPLNHARVKGVGGSTLHWQGMVMRLHEDDFASGTERGVGPDWPIEYADLQPYYAAAERELGVAGAADNPYAPPRAEPYPLPAFPPSHSDALFTTACESLEIDMHSVPNARASEPYRGRSACVGYGTCQPVCPSRAKYDATIHVERAEEQGATVIDRAPVQRLAHTPDRVTAAVYTTPDGTTHRQSADAFVVACGGVETPRLLLASASKAYPDGVANSSGHVGSFFYDHLFAGVGGVLDEPTRQHHVGFYTSGCDQFYDDAGTIERANEIQRSILEALGADIQWTVGPADTGPAYHHMGTTRMSADPAAGVVDTHCQTHDLDNCWIASSAVFPTGGAMNPTLTIAALALRAAAHIESTL